MTGHRLYARKGTANKTGREDAQTTAKKRGHMLRKDKQAAAKSIEVFEAIGDANVVVKVDGKECGAEMFPALIAAGVVVGSRLHTDRELRSESADEIIRIVMGTAVGIEKEYYGEHHRKTYEESRAYVERRFYEGCGSADEDAEERDRAMAQASLDDEPDKAEED